MYKVINWAFLRLLSVDLAAHEKLSLLDKEGRFKKTLVKKEKTMEQLPKEFKTERSRIMYIEDKSSGIVGAARIGRVYFSKTGKTLYYNQRKLQSLNGSGFKSNYIDVESRDEFWISGPKKDRNDRLYGGSEGVEIDDDVKEEYIGLLKGL